MSSFSSPSTEISRREWTEKTLPRTRQLESIYIGCDLSAARKSHDFNDDVGRSPKLGFSAKNKIL